MASSATQLWLPAWVLHLPCSHLRDLLVGVHVFGEIQMDEAGVASMDQGSKELPEWRCKLCQGPLSRCCSPSHSPGRDGYWDGMSCGGCSGGSAPVLGLPSSLCFHNHIPAGMGWQHLPAAWHRFGREVEGRDLLPGPPVWVLTASKGQSVPARLRWESTRHWWRRLCRFCGQRFLSSFTQEPDHHHPLTQHPRNPSSSLAPAGHRNESCTGGHSPMPIAPWMSPCSRWDLPPSHEAIDMGSESSF